MIHMVNPHPEITFKKGFHPQNHFHFILILTWRPPIFANEGHFFLFLLTFTGGKIGLQIVWGVLVSKRNWRFGDRIFGEEGFWRGG
jgi:hypothetical protein